MTISKTSTHFKDVQDKTTVIQSLPIKIIEILEKKKMVMIEI